MKKKTPVALLITMLAYAGLCTAQSDHQKIDKYFTNHYEKAKIIGLQVASIGDGELVWQGSYGEKENLSGDMVNDSTLFLMASCTKPVTSLGIMKLYDDIND